MFAEARDAKIRAVGLTRDWGTAVAKQDISVEDLVGMIARGELRLPEMQREYVWRGPRVRDLLDSLYRGYPSGAVLVWETEEPVPLRDMAIAQAENPYQKTLLLLDGQQRLTSLSAVLRGEPLSVAGRKLPIELLFNLDHPDLTPVSDVDEDADDDLAEDAVDDDELARRINDSTFVIGTKKIAALSQWVRVSDVFKSGDNGPFLQRAGLTGFGDPRYGRYSQRLDRLRAVRKYEYRMDVLERSLTYEDVTDIFVRVNSLGAKLRSSDLALAQITAKWRHSLALFQAFQAECAKEGFDLDLGIHLKALIAFATGQSRFKTVSRLTLEQLQTAWTKATEGMRFAINFLRSNVGINSPALLSSPFLMVTIAYWGHRKSFQLTADEAANLRRWALLSSTKGRYSRGSSETILDQDLAVIARDEPVAALIDRVRLQFGRLDVSAEDLEGKDQRSPLFKTMFLALGARGAKDWQSHLAISLNHAGVAHRLEFHHFFPKALLAKAGYPPREADDLANLAFISGKTNRSFGDRAPLDYAKALHLAEGDQPFKEQCVPVDPALWEVSAYPQFLAERRRLLAQAVNSFVDGERLGPAPAPLSLEALIAEGEHERLEFKSSLRWDTKEQKPNKALEQVVLKSIAALANGKGGRLIIGVRDDGSVHGLAADYACLGNGRDKFERHLRTLAANCWGDADAIGAFGLAFMVAGEEDVCVVEVAPGMRPRYVEVQDKAGSKAEKFFVRNGNASVPIEAPSEQAAYIAKRFPNWGA